MSYHEEEFGVAAISDSGATKISPAGNGTALDVGPLTVGSGTMADREVPRPPVAEMSADGSPERTVLFQGAELEGFNSRWSDIQTSFVDEPRRAVENANVLVSDVIARIGDSFGKQRGQLEEQWDGGAQVSTEELRLVFQRYRSFFSRLLEM